MDELRRPTGLLVELEVRRVQQVLALSSDKATYQQDLVRRLHLPDPLLSDPGLALASALQLPTFQGAGVLRAMAATVLTGSGDP